MKSLVQRLEPFLPVGLLLLLLAISFGRTLQAPFLLYDDPQHIMNNAWLKSGEFWHFWTTPYFGLYIPVTYTLWTAVYQLCKEPWAFHALNILLHTISAWLVFRITRLRLSQLASLCAATVFALHPLQLETVAWVAGGRDLTGACLGLLALYLSLRHLRALALICFALSMLAKPSLVVLPVALFFLDPKKLKEALVWLVATGPVIIITSKVQAGFVNAHLEQLSLFERMLVATDALGFYLQKVFWPWPLIPDYSRALNAVLAQEMYLKTGPLVLLAFSGAAWLWWRKDKVTLLGPALFVTLLVPVLGFVPFLAQAQSTVADRYAYLAIFGVAWAFAVFVEHLPRLLYPALALFVAWTYLNFLNSESWTSDRAVFAHILEHNEDSYLAHANLGVMDFQENQMGASETHFLKAMKLEPLLAIAPSNLAQLYWRTGQPGKILSDIAQRLSNPEFLRYNEHEISLPVIFQLVARTVASTGNFAQAVPLYCEALKKDRDADLQREAGKVFAMAAKATGQSITCP